MSLPVDQYKHLDATNSWACTSQAVESQERAVVLSKVGGKCIKYDVLKQPLLLFAVCHLLFLATGVKDIDTGRDTEEAA